MQHGKTLRIAGMLLSLTAVNAQASLTLTDNGLGVYDSALDATWTRDANLLGTLENTYGYSTIVDAIIAAKPVIHNTPNGNDNGGKGVYNLSANDFGVNGQVNWWAAQAYVSYLNSLNNGSGYGGSNQWALPTTPDSDNSFGYNQTDSQLGELYYNELNALAYPGTNGSNFGILHDGSYNTSSNAGPFSNTKTYVYWSGTEYAADPYFAWAFTTSNGGQGSTSKGNPAYAWAASPGLVSAVPLPGAAWLFGAGMLGLLGLRRRDHAGCGCFG